MTTTTSSEKEIKKEVNEPQVENNQPEKESFFKRHKKKIIGILSVIGIAAGGAYLYTRSNKKADTPSQETAESKEAVNINKEEQQPQRGDRDDRRNRHNGGNHRQQW